MPCRRGVAVFDAPVDDVQGAHTPALDNASPVKHVGDNGIPGFGLMGLS